MQGARPCSVPNAQLLELPRDERSPISVGGRASGAGVQDSPHKGLPRRKDQLKAAPGKIADANQPFGPEHFHDGSQVVIAGGEPVIQRGEADPSPGGLGLGVVMPVDQQLGAAGRGPAERARLGGG